MGMFDKDRLLGGKRLQEEYSEGEPFLLYDITVAGEVDLDNGLPPAEKTVLMTQKLGEGDTPIGEPFQVGALGSALARKAREKEDGDLPAIVQWAKVPGQADQMALVIQFVRPFLGKASKAPELVV